MVLVGIIALAGGVYVKQSSFFPQQKPSTPLLEFSLPDTTNTLRNSKEWYGKILIINFWATWCPPCLKEIPDFIKLQHEFKEKNLQFVGIAIDNKQSVEDYLKTININYPILIGNDEAIGLAYKLGNIVNAVPFTVIVNPEGIIIHRQPGEISREKILDVIKPLLVKQQKLI